MANADVTHWDKSLDRWARLVQEARSSWEQFPANLPVDADYAQLEAGTLDVYVIGPETATRFEVEGLEGYPPAPDGPRALPAHSFFIYGALVPPSPSVIAMSMHAGDTWDGSHGHIQVVSYRAEKHRVRPHRGWKFDLSQDWDSLFWEYEDSPRGADDVLVLAETLGILLYEDVSIQTVSIPESTTDDVLHVLP